MQSDRIRARKLGLIMTLLIPMTWLLAQVQESGAYKTFDVYIYPEYDHPGVGIFIEGEVLPGQFPRFLELQVPEETTVALIRRPSQGETGGERIEIQRRDGKAFLPVDVNESRFQIQFYFNPFKGQDGQRTFRYDLSTNEELPGFHVVVQQPLAAENFEHSLDQAEQLTGEFDLVFYRQHIEGLSPGDVHTISVSYENPTQALTMNLLQSRMEQAQAQRAAVPSQPDRGSSNLILVLLIVAVLGLALFIVMKVWGGPGGAAVTAAAKKDDSASAVRPSKDKGRSGGKFCAGCGAPRRSEGRFCPNCGKEY